MINCRKTLCQTLTATAVATTAQETPVKSVTQAILNSPLYSRYCLPSTPSPASFMTPLN